MKKILSSGVLGKMEKAMLLLVQKSALGAADQERGEASRPNNSVSIELLDDQGGRAPDNFSKKAGEDGCGELVPRKRVRESNMPSQGET